MKPEPMRAAEFRRLREMLNITHSRLASLLGADPRTPRRWEAAERDVPPAVAGILRLLAAGLITPRQVWQAVHGVTIDRSRKSSK